MLVYVCKYIRLRVSPTNLGLLLCVGNKSAAATKPISSNRCARGRSWLQDTVKRKLADFAWNRRFFFAGRVLAFFRVNPAKRFNQPDLL